MSRKRRIGIVVGAAVLLNVLGIARIPGGPLTHEGWFESPLRGFESMNLVAVSARTDGFGAGAPLYMTVDVRSRGPFDVSLEGIEALNRDESVDIEYLGVAPPGPTHDGLSLAGAIEIPGGWEQHLGTPLSRTVLEPSGAEPQYASILLSLTAEEAGEHSVGPFAVDSRMGPFTFRYIYPVSYILCTGMAGEPHPGECPEPTDEEE